MDMKEFYDLICRSVEKGVKMHTKGKVKASVEDDTLYIKVDRKGLSYTWSKSNIAESIARGMTDSQAIIHEFTKTYRKVITNIFFN